MSKYSEACCKIPPIVDEGYEPKGRYIELNGTKTYVTGPADSDRGILAVYDIFGFFPQTIQGADILAYGDADRKYQVFMPDFFEGNTAELEWYPPTDDDKKAKIGKWFQEVAVWSNHMHKVRDFLGAAEVHNNNIKSWGIMGYCWGGKMASILAGTGRVPFRVAVQTSPGTIDAGDAANVKIPTMVLASGDEDVEDVRKYEENLKVPKHVEIFKDQTHGFMSTRANLKDVRVRAEYERGYKLALGFFHDHF